MGDLSLRASGLVARDGVAPETPAKKRPTKVFS